ncbi:hypothetical protein QBC43DRAFT_286975 [Cladorrhinum sp. PSN259]|nr:hypothetical protein QBC43DRAFT_286975 [Cladorrhinum sp. PSN259]
MGSMQRQQQQLAFGYDLSQGQVDPSLVEQPTFQLNPFDPAPSADLNNLDLASSEEVILTQENRNTLAHFFSFAANNEPTFDFAGSRSYGEGVGALAQNWGWIAPDTVIGHEITFPGDQHLNGMLQASFPGMDQTTFPGNTQYSVQPQHIFNEMATQSSEAAGGSTSSRSRTAQNGPQVDIDFNTNTIQNMPILSGRPQQQLGHGDAVNPSRQFHEHTAYGLPTGPSFARQRRPSRPPPSISFGTDPNFNHGGFYVPSSTRDTTEQIAAVQLATLGCLERNPSAAPTRAPSPALPNVSEHISESIAEQANGELHQRPMKRRKSSRPDDEQKPKAYQSGVTSIITTVAATPTPSLPSPGSTPTSATTKKRRPGTERTFRDVITPPAAGKRKRPSSAPAKPPRENLSEEQKRNNHIKSEQKRRNAIKCGFEELNKVIPACKGGGYSKAVVLVHTYDFVERLHQGNQELRKLLQKIAVNGNGAESASSSSE